MSAPQPGTSGCRETPQPSLEAFYEAAGGSYEEVLGRLRSSDRILRFLQLFAKDPSFATLEQAMAAQDEEGAFRASHTLKGSASNMGLTQLAHSASDLCEALRAHQWDEACTLLPPTQKDYRRFEDAFDRFLANR